MRTIDFAKWRNFNKGDIVPSTQKTTVLLAAPGPLYAHQGKVKILVGYGTEFYLDTSQVEKLSSPEQSGTISHDPAKFSKGAKEIYTNVAKIPSQSAATDFVMNAVRQQKIADKLKQKTAMNAARLQQQKRIDEGIQEEFSDDVKQHIEEEKETKIKEDKIAENT